MRYETHGRARKGVASNYVAERLKKGARVRVKLKPNKHFALPAPDATSSWSAPAPASRRSAPSCRSAAPQRAKGRNWLFFGDRQFTHDFLYQTEWQDALKDGASDAHGCRLLARHAREGLRAAPHLGEAPRPGRVARRRRELLRLRRRQAMAKDVRATLVRAYADVKSLSPEAAEQAVAALERDKRYQQDVY